MYLCKVSQIYYRMKTCLDELKTVSLCFEAGFSQAKEYLVGIYLVVPGVIIYHIWVQLSMMKKYRKGVLQHHHGNSVPFWGAKCDSSWCLDLPSIPNRTVTYVLYFKFLFHGRIIALQCCVGVCVYRHESALGIPRSPPYSTCLSPPTPPHPSRLLQSPGLSSLQIPIGDLFYIW